MSLKFYMLISFFITPYLRRFTVYITTLQKFGSFSTYDEFTLLLGFVILIRFQVLLSFGF